MTTPPGARLAVRLDFVLQSDQVGSKVPGLDNLVQATIDALDDVIGPRPGNWEHRLPDDERIDEIVARKRTAIGDQQPGASIVVGALSGQPQ